MGNSETKSSQRQTQLSENEVHALQVAIQKSEIKDRLTEEVLLKKLDFPKGSEVWLYAMWAILSRKSRHPGLAELESLYETAVYGNLGERVEFISFLLQQTRLSPEQFSLWLVQGAELITPAWEDWLNINCNISEESRLLFTNFLNYDHTGKKFDDVETLLIRRPVITTLLKALFRHSFNCTEGHPCDLFPMLIDVDSSGPKPSILQSSDVLFLNSILPHDLACEWRLLFSTARHGQSFSTLVSKIINQGPTVLVIRDTDKYIFGGFASVSWSIGPNFVGGNSCFLFTLTPKMSVCETTGYNDHYMYLNQQQQTLPNGLGMGGQHGYFGFWLDAEFGLGHSSKTCTTYGDFSQLSKKPEFNFDHIEVWAVGKPQPLDPDSDEPNVNARSILDRDPAAKALLEMVDRGQHSEGLREPEPT